MNVWCRLPLYIYIMIFLEVSTSFLNREMTHFSKLNALELLYLELLSHLYSHIELLDHSRITIFVGIHVDIIFINILKVSVKCIKHMVTLVLKTLYIWK